VINFTGAPNNFPVKRSLFFSLCALCVLCGEIFTSPFLQMYVLSIYP
jgi:hypothetical protein